MPSRPASPISRKIAGSVRLFEIGFLDPGRQLVGREGRRGIADHPLVLGELILDQERVVPDEGAAEPSSLATGWCKVITRSDRALWRSAF